MEDTKSARDFHDELTAVSVAVFNLAGEMLQVLQITPAVNTWGPGAIDMFPQWRLCARPKARGGQLLIAEYSFERDVPGRVLQLDVELKRAHWNSHFRLAPLKAKSEMQVDVLDGVASTK